MVEIDILQTTVRTLGICTCFKMYTYVNFYFRQSITTTFCHNGNNHKIKTIDGQSHNVTEIVTYDAKKDFVLFQNDINGNVPYLKLATQLPEEGEEIIVLGNPTGLESTLTRGIVSALREENGIIYIQIDAAISPGSSGSPVLNLKGEVVGIATLKKMDCESCNFAVSIKTIANQIGL